MWVTVASLLCIEEDGDDDDGEEEPVVAEEELDEEGHLLRTPENPIVKSVKSIGDAVVAAIRWLFYNCGIPGDKDPLLWIRIPNTDPDPHM